MLIFDAVCRKNNHKVIAVKGWALFYVKISPHHRRPIVLDSRKALFNLRVDVPGLTIKDIDISLQGKILTLSGERKKQDEEAAANVHRLECRYDSFKRSIELPANVDHNRVRASYEQGVLKIRLPKSSTQSAKKIEVKAL